MSVQELLDMYVQYVMYTYIHEIDLSTPRLGYVQSSYHPLPLSTYTQCIGEEEDKLHSYLM